MIKQSTLDKIETDIAERNYGKARDRLHSLIFSYPNDLDLRKQLGDIYYHLDYPEMAGRYWFLEEIKTPEMELACNLFTQSSKSDDVIRSKLKFKGNISELNNDYAIDKLKSLGYRPMDPQLDLIEKIPIQLTTKQIIQNNLIRFGCAAILGLTLLFAIIGLVNTIIYLLRR